MVSEMFLTFGLASVVVMVAVEKNRSTFLGECARGLSAAYPQR